MFDERKLRTFLVQVPKPAKIVVHTDAEAREITPGSGITWASMAQTIVALGDSARLVECYAKDGALLRAFRADEPEPAGKAAAPVAAAIYTDPETARWAAFAGHLSNAWQFSTGLAFDKMVALFEMQNERMVAIEQRLERTEALYRKNLNEQLEDAFATVAEQMKEAQQQPKQQSPLLEMAEHFLGGMAAANDTVRPPPNGHANGHANGHSNGNA